MSDWCQLRSWEEIRREVSRNRRYGLGWPPLGDNEDELVVDTSVSVYRWVIEWAECGKLGEVLEKGYKFKVSSYASVSSLPLQIFTCCLTFKQVNYSWFLARTLYWLLLGKILKLLEVLGFCNIFVLSFYAFHLHFMWLAKTKWSKIVKSKKNSPINRVTPTIGLNSLLMTQLADEGESSGKVYSIVGL